MSGILCVYSPSGIEQDSQHYLAALRRLAHRGLDGEGSVLRQTIFLGVRRSSVGRGSKGEQPFVSDDGKLTVALDGHIHNREELSHGLRAKGYPAEVSSDAALVLSAYSAYGEQCFERFRGVWALVLWDEREHRLLAVRDPLGARPLYYYIGARNLLVASEIKSIIYLDADARPIDHRRVRALICEGLIDDWTATCFSRIKPVPNGTVQRIDGSQIKANRYWNLRPSPNANLSLADIRDTLVSAVKRHTPAEVRVGLALSGGIDSSSIAGILAQSPLRERCNVHAFSIKPPKTDDESFLIDATIRRTGIPHTYVLADGLDYSRSLARLIDFHDEPIQFSGVFYQFVLREKMAEAACKAVLVGYGADEIFSGYPYLAPAFLAALIAHGRLRDSARFIFCASEFLESTTFGILKKTLRYSLSRAPGFRAIKRTRWYEAYKRARGNLPGLDVLAPFDDTEESEPSSSLAEFGLQGVDRGQMFLRALLDCFRTNIPLLVRLEDRNAMAHGLDLCAPFMDQDVVQNALAFPFYRYMEGGRNKAILRDAMRELLAPEVVAYRRKVATPGNDAYVAFKILQPEFSDILNSESFRTEWPLVAPVCRSLRSRLSPWKQADPVVPGLYDT